MYRKMDTAIDGSCACIQAPFSAVRTALTGKISPPFERTGNFDLEAILKFCIYFCI
jgi:hypothetical protein